MTLVTFANIVIVVLTAKKDRVSLKQWKTDRNSSFVSECLFDLHTINKFSSPFADFVKFCKLSDLRENELYNVLQNLRTSTTSANT